MQDPSCPCQQEDPAAAFLFHSQNRETHIICDESHFIVNLTRCNVCGQRYLQIFYELIDFLNGDDSQARNLIPIDQSLWMNIWDRRDAIDPCYFESLPLSGKHLLYVHPSNQEPRYVWIDGPVTHFPHD